MSKYIGLATDLLVSVKIKKAYIHRKLGTSIIVHQNKAS